VTQYPDILQILVKEKVDFVVIGGVAAILQGSTHLTKDIDFCYSRDEENLERIVKALRQNTGATLRVDANAGWDIETALRLIPQLKELGVELVEQPLARDNWEGMKILYKESSLPLFADEACVFEQDVEKCKDHFHGINIKLTKCSGITPARRMIKKARELNMSVMVGAMNESTIGSAAIAHLMPLIDHVDADGPLLQEDDLATGLLYENDGRIITSPQPGLGITFTDLYKK